MDGNSADIGCRTCYESIETRCSPCDECGHIDEEDGADDDTQRVTVHDGCKQVKLDGEHLADCANPKAARVIAICLNRAGLPWNKWPDDEADIVAEFFA